MRDEILRKLDSDELKANLARAGLFLAAFEIMRGQIEGSLRGFFAEDFKNLEALPSQKYRDEVLSRHKSSLTASVLWYVEMDVLEKSDVDAIESIRSYRNQIAHELPNYLLGPGYEIDLDAVRAMQRYIDVVGGFWARTWAETDPDYDHVDLDSSPPESLASIVMGHLLDALGDEAS